MVETRPFYYKVGCVDSARTQKCWLLEIVGPPPQQCAVWELRRVMCSVWSDDIEVHRYVKQHHRELEKDLGYASLEMENNVIPSLTSFRRQHPRRMAPPFVQEEVSFPLHTPCRGRGKGYSHGHGHGHFKLEVAELVASVRSTCGLLSMNFGEYFWVYFQVYVWVTIGSHV